ncbi:glycosyltransferase [Flavobacterium sp. LC2016-01]|uniref:glycosyltransferase family 2 protein n=1 Tax=Flavobacterium sp. LC2016-01 TaxID=2675876 RepID=UPI0012BA5A13|nr:glycosyltransferase [Flavobacterium sp. LC2016-01]MTH17545.1 glycosyltransferase family 2 protein [Flavobacterium sp. LC2016-01]
MRASILIVSKNRKQDLFKTLNILESLIDKSEVEVLVFLDGCTDESESLKNEFIWVKWFISMNSIGASGARHQIYPLANSEILIGLDDDAHPLSIDFLDQIENLFQKSTNVGILAFEEIKGVFQSDQEAIRQAETEKKEYLTSEFIGCGFAIRKSVYNLTNGFPVWIDIYGEESCLSIEVISKGYDILYTNQVKINHRVNKEQRKLNKQNYFRFGKQLKNSTFYFLVYYPFPLINILKLYWHNFKKYALTDWECCKIYFKTLFIVMINIPKILSYRNAIDKTVILKMRGLSRLKF